MPRRFFSAPCAAMTSEATAGWCREHYLTRGWVWERCPGGRAHIPWHSHPVRHHIVHAACQHGLTGCRPGHGSPLASLGGALLVVAVFLALRAAVCKVRG